MNDRFYLKNVKINSFRGLRDFKIDKFGDVNLVLGDNNSGKTSLLESIYLLRNNDIYNFLDVAKTRIASNLTLRDIAFMHNFDTKTIDIKAATLNEDINFYATYKIDTISFDRNVYFSNENKGMTSAIVDNILKSLVDAIKPDGKQMKQINGSVSYNNHNKNYSLIDLDLVANIQKDMISENTIAYLSPSAHYKITSNNISKIIKNKNYYNILIELLHLFDPTIEDIIVASSDDVFGTYGIEIRRKDHVFSEPISLFGDGLKKAIVLATYLVEAANGILLIDEVETSLHYSLFNDIFSFLILAAERFNVQLFIATHNEEAIDAMLNVSDERLESTTLLTLKNDNGKLKYMYLNGKEAKKYRDNVKMELR